MAGLIVCLAGAASLAGPPDSTGRAATKPSTRPASRAAVGRIVVVHSGSAAPYLQAGSALKGQLAKLGHRARTVPLERLPADLPALLGRTDAFVGVGTEAALYLHKRLKPPARMAYCMVANPLGVGLTGNPPPPGVTTDIPVSSQFALIAEALPGARNVGMLYRSSRPRSRRIFEAARASLPKGWSLAPVDMGKHSSTAAAIGALLAQKVDIVWTAPDRSVFNVATIRSLLLGAMRRRVPVFGFSTGLVRAGAWLGVGIDPAAQGRQAAAIAHGFVRRQATSHPATRKVATPAAAGPVAPEFQIAVNLVVAKRLGIALPEGLVRRAAFVVREEELRR